eukprot:JP439572.1.p2 GENE.JP439572.1~~JP439572.1.p2  ORF type:complete len:120 (-),score=21.15 JP439572.1:30-389(-)
MTSSPEPQFEQRCAESTKIRQRYPDRTPVIIDKYDKDTVLGDVELNKRKFLVPTEHTFGQLQVVIRKRLALGSTVALWLFCGNSLVPSGAVIGEVYKEHRSEDGFLYVKYSGENAFGAC